jgi:hypothetical protein
MTAGSISRLPRSTEERPYRRLRRPVMSSSLTNPRLTKARLKLTPLSFSTISASWSCCGVTMFSFSSRSPSFTAMLTLERVEAAETAGGNAS